MAAREEEVPRAGRRPGGRRARAEAAGRGGGGAARGLEAEADLDADLDSSGAAPAEKRARRAGRAALLDAEDWGEMRRLYDARGELREVALSGAREMQRDAKRAICALHRGDLGAAESLLQKAGGPGSRVSEFFGPLGLKGPVDSVLGTLRPLWGGAMEEYAEAWLFLNFLVRATELGREDSWDTALAPRSALAESSPAGRLVTESEYIGGALDFCGEMNRWAVRRASERDAGRVGTPAYASLVSHCRDLAVAVQEELLQFDFRNGELRRKFDALKYTVRNLERVLYDLALSPREPSPAPARG